MLQLPCDHFDMSSNNYDLLLHNTNIDLAFATSCAIGYHFLVRLPKPWVVDAHAPCIAKFLGHPSLFISMLDPP